MLGIGTWSLAEMYAHERTAPAGRFVGERGHDTLGHDVVWVEYDAAVSIHRVITTQASENRLQRLATATVDDKRISYGFINVPVAFYETYIRPVFSFGACRSTSCPKSRRCSRSSASTTSP